MSAQNNFIISVICPVLNEEKHIDRLLASLLEINPRDKEILIIDGGSQDGTVDKVSTFQAKYPNIKLLHNSYKTVPFALNLGIKASNGNILVRVDAHSEYESDYFEKIISVFEQTGADIVGGPTRIANGSAFQEAVGKVISHPFGTGNSKVHDTSFEGYTDHVTFGAWKKNIFDEIGYFDTNLTRNQDDEFHYRAKSLGKKVYQSPLIKLYYYPRNNLLSLSRQYFEYGYYKPLVLRKVKSEIKLRHLIPSIFFLYLIFIPIGFVSYLYFLPLVTYFIIIFMIALSEKTKIKTKLLMTLIFPVIHLSYGAGFIFYFIKKFILGK